MNLSHRMISIILATNCCTIFLSAESPKSELMNLQDNQQIVDNSLLELHVIPNFLPEEKLITLKGWINDMMDDAYEDFDKRVGIVWDDYTLDITESPKLLKVDFVKKFVNINGVAVEQFPQSIFNYSKISKILLQDILPPYFKAVSQHAELPNNVYMQTFVLRSLLTEDISNQKQHVRWHQDPSDYDNSIADYTLVLMLSDPFDPSKGWRGGELLLKNGLPVDEAPAILVTPKFNQAVLFNNKKNSHLVTAIKNAKNNTTRDIVIINIYLKDPSLI